MIQLFTAPTGNGHRVSIMLEEVGLPYTVIPIDFAKGEHQGEALAAVNPLGQIPAIFDPDGPDGQPMSLGESAAILGYLARKTGKLLPEGLRGLAEADRWTTIAAGGLQAAPTTIFFARQLGEADHAKIIGKQYEMITRYLAMMEQRLSASPYLTGPHYTYVDILAFTLVNGTLKLFGVEVDSYQAICKWRDAIGKRTAVQQGLAVPPTN